MAMQRTIIVAKSLTEMKQLAEQKHRKPHRRHKHKSNVTKKRYVMDLTHADDHSDDVDPIEECSPLPPYIYNTNRNPILDPIEDCTETIRSGRRRLHRQGRLKLTPVARRHGKRCRNDCTRHGSNYKARLKIVRPLKSVQTVAVVNTPYGPVRISDIL